MQITVRTVDNNGTYREIGTATEVSIRSWSEGDASPLGTVIRPNTHDHATITLEGYTPESPAPGYIVRGLLSENEGLRQQLEMAKENFEHNLKVTREEYKQKLSNQQRNFEELCAGQERAAKMRKDAEKKLAEAQRLSRRTGGFESVVDEQAAEIKELEKKVIARELERDGFKASRDYWIDRTRDSDARYFALGQKMRDILEEAA